VRRGWRNSVELLGEHAVCAAVEKTSKIGEKKRKRTRRKRSLPSIPLISVKPTCFLAASSFDASYLPSIT